VQKSIKGEPFFFFFEIFFLFQVCKMKLRLVFSGGSEVLFNDKREHDVEVPDQMDVKKLLDWVLENLIEVGLIS
jgi:light-regulated signal transduction histidine kinase (bacteriophytochrome)